MCPLLERVAPSEVTRLGSTTVRRVGGSPDLLVLTAPQAGVSRGRVTTRGGKPEAERWLYLTLVGDDQETLADGYLAAIDGLLGRRSLSYGGYASGSVPVAYPDAAASLWATFLRHEKHHVVTCRQCGRSVLAPLQGPRREFCSDTCRAAHAKRLRDKRLREPFLR